MSIRDKIEQYLEENKSSSPYTASCDIILIIRQCLEKIIDKELKGDAIDEFMNNNNTEYEKLELITLALLQTKHMIPNIQMELKRLGYNYDIDSVRKIVNKLQR